MNQPRYVSLYKDGTLKQSADQAHALLSSCTLCPRRCHVNRMNDEVGFCRTGKLPIVCSFMVHRGEEPPISGTYGSGTIFFSYCNLHCVYCQNYQFSQLGEGEAVTSERLAAFMLALQKQGCHNINVVTPTHVMPQILDALVIAAEKGLNIPLVYNTSGYELPGVIKLLDGIVDIYLVDMRYTSDTHSRHYSQAPDYPKYNQAALKEMHRQVGDAENNEDGIMTRGIIVRHLVLPSGISGSDEIFRFLSAEVSRNTYISLMSQYSPYYKACNHREIARRITKEEYHEAIDAMHRHGLHQGWTQDDHGLESLAGVHIKKNI